MTQSDDLLSNYNYSLNIAAFEPTEGGDALRVVGAAPEWLEILMKESRGSADTVNLALLFPFLENFIIDAQNLWNQESKGHIKTGPWLETGYDGEEIYLTAKALKFGDKSLLTIEPANIEDDINENVLQKAREVTLAYQALDKEKQKTKMLLNYIVHDLKNPLMVLQSAIILLQKEELSELGEEIIESSTKALDNQDQLINDVLDVFSSDFYAKDPLIYDRQFAPDVLTCAEDVIDKILPAFKLNQVAIVLDPHLDKDVERVVVGEKAKLCRIVCNLTENALRHSPKDSSVLITIEDDGDHLKLAVKDEGPGIPDDILSDIFERVSKGKRKSGSTGLGLFFCRSMIEHWGGQIGYTPRPEGGSEFWIRLPKLTPDG